MTRVLVTGGTGFLGRVVCKWLSAMGVGYVALAREGVDSQEVLRGDVTRPMLGLRADQFDELLRSVTHVVAAHGSVDWQQDFDASVRVHQIGARNVVDFCQRSDRIERLVAVSSLLALGRARGTIGNRQLAVGQRFRNPYEYSKYLMEHEFRAASDLPAVTVRFGPLLGLSEGRPPSTRHGLLAAIAPLIAGYPVHLDRQGEFPSYIGDVDRAAEVVVHLLLAADDPDRTMTFFDPERPTVRDVLIDLCRPWRVVPRIVDMPVLGWIQRPLAGRIGFPPTLLEYAKPWFELTPDVLGDLPGVVPSRNTDYIHATAEALLLPGCVR